MNIDWIVNAIKIKITIVFTNNTNAILKLFILPTIILLFYLNWNVCMRSPSTCINVLFFANIKVFSYPVSANVNSDPRCSYDTGFTVVPSISYIFLLLLLMPRVGSVIFCVVVASVVVVDTGNVSVKWW